MISIPVCAEDEPAYPPLSAQPQIETVHPEWGGRIQRTMRLLATSTPDHRNKVRILFYGQSTTGSRYSCLIEKWLREQYPYADLEVENRAIGGYDAKLLCRTAESDLYPYYPDLLVFGVCGDHHRYEEIIFNTRQRTSAEVMIVSFHWRAIEFQEGQYELSKWETFMDSFLGRLSEKYGCELVSVHEPWREYLMRNNLTPQDLLIDDVHPNPHGKWLFAELCKRQMIYRPGMTAAGTDALAKDYLIGIDVQWRNGKLELEFEGNRVDWISKAGPGGGASVRVLVDGKRPGELRDLFAFSRPTSLVNPSEWPAIGRISARNVPVEEEWRAEITDVDQQNNVVKFRVIGSVTGEDGEGASDTDFVSKSGRVVIEAFDWQIYPKRIKSYASGMTIRWKCFPMHRNIFHPSIQLDDLRENATILLQGLPNGKHRIELVSDGGETPPISAIRVYRPPLPAGEFRTMGYDPD